MPSNEPTTVADVVVNASRIAVSQYVYLAKTYAVQMQMKSEDPSAPDPTPLPCLPYRPGSSQELEDKIYTLISNLANQIIDLMNANPGLEFGTVVSVGSDGTLTAQSFEMPSDHRTALNVAGLPYGQVIALIHGHPQQPIGYPRPLYNAQSPAYGLMPSPSEVIINPDGSTRAVGDWVSHQFWIDQINAAGGRGDLFRQYIVAWGAYAMMERPRWHLTEPDAGRRLTALDYLANKTQNGPTQSLPISVTVSICEGSQS